MKSDKFFDILAICIAYGFFGSIIIFIVSVFLISIYSILGIVMFPVIFVIVLICWACERTFIL